MGISRISLLDGLSNKMAVKGGIFLQLRTCLCRYSNFKLRKTYSSSRQFSAGSSQCRIVSRTTFLQRFLAGYMPIAKYYVKSKERKGPSLKTWFSVGAGVIACGAGIIVYLGKLFCLSFWFTVPGKRLLTTM